MGATPMTVLSPDAKRHAAFDRWALAVATAFIVLIVAGVLPRVLQ